jgi:hypothetical protein
MSRIRELRGGRDNDPRFGTRHSGEGVFADLFAKRFELARRKNGFSDNRLELDTSRFRPPAPTVPQLALF